MKRDTKALKKNLSNTINWKDVHFAKNNLVTKINEAN